MLFTMSLLKEAPNKVNFFYRFTFWNLAIPTIGKVKILTSYFDNNYSRVHKSLDSFFSKILDKPSIVEKKNDTSYERAAFFTEMKQKKIQNGRLKKFKMGWLNLYGREAVWHKLQIRQKMHFWCF